MAVASHQTIRISRGRHAGPQEGACVMELASMLAGEPFGDHPACASPVVAAFLRAYNDGVGDDLRQTLRPYAATVVGTRGDDALEGARSALCERWTEQVLDGDRGLRRRRWRLVLETRRVDGLTPQGVGRTAGVLASMLARRDGDAGHERVVRMLDRLIALRIPPLERPDRGTLEHAPVDAEAGAVAGAVP
jgi:hypothetical protein